MVSEKNTEPRIGLITKDFPDFKGTVVSSDSLGKLLRIKKDSGEEVDICINPFDDSSRSFSKAIKKAKSLEIDMPYKVSFLANNGNKRIRVTKDYIEPID
ncbi:MAG: hypothetical protein PHO56_01175 [Patescibacteria group bacterium]|nr:hypothetical protein [Patescibacteria group bacterium]